MSKPQIYRGFKGIDVRKLPQASPLDTHRVANNLDLTVNGGYVNRDPFQVYATVHANSVGLYALGGSIRCAIAGGHSVVPPPGVVYDEIGAGGTAYPLSSVVALTGWETIGSDVTQGLKPYLVVQKSDGTFEHHYIQKPVYPSSVTPNTKVVLPYRPGPGLVKMVEKLWAIDNYNNGVPYSSVTNGPTDWTFANDAGELPTADQISGDRTIAALGQQEGQLIVFYEDCIQAWNVFADPTNPSFGIQKVVNGPGTQSPFSIDNVRGDLFYFSQGSFRRLQKNLLTGQFREGDLGKEIRPITRAISPTLVPGAFGRWSQWRQQYVCAIGSTVYCYLDCTLDGQTNAGWTTWTAPGPVSAIVELDTVLYIRVGNVIYQMVSDGDPDLIEPGMQYSLVSQFHDGGSRHVAKTWDFAEVTMTGEGATLDLYDDPTNPNTPIPNAFALDPSAAPGRVYTPLVMNSNFFGWGLSGHGLLQFEQLDIHYTQLGA